MIVVPPIHALNYFVFLLSLLSFNEAHSHVWCTILRAHNICICPYLRLLINLWFLIFRYTYALNFFFACNHLFFAGIWCHNTNFINVFFQMFRFHNAHTHWVWHHFAVLFDSNIWKLHLHVVISPREMYVFPHRVRQRLSHGIYRNISFQPACSVSHQWCCRSSLHWLILPTPPCHDYVSELG
jgi:hypothetical protein